MQTNNTQEPQNFRRAFLSIFSTSPKEIKKPLMNHEHLEKILNLQKEIQELKYQNHFLKKGKSTPTPTPTPQTPLVQVEEAPTQPTKSSSIETIDYLHLLRENSLEYVLGRRNNATIIGNISEEPHLLIAGKTGSGKSVTMFNILVSILNSNTPNSLQISLIDPKILTFGDKRIVGSNYLKEKPSVGDNNQALTILQNAYDDMMKRYKIMVERGVKDYRDISLPAHVIFIDEIFELLEGANAKEILPLITRIASLGRAGGVHLVMATQSPRAKTLSGTLKANLEFIGHKMSNPIESKLIELPKAHELKGKGDGLRVIDGEMTRFQATFIDANLDGTYTYFHSKQYARKMEKEQSKYADVTTAQNVDIKALRELKKKIIETSDNQKVQPKSSFISLTSRGDLALWQTAINELKSEELIIFRKGKGYFLAADYSIAMVVIEGRG
jgi:energy-coupling factor transporter ATP-binding protein EcfA2